MKSTRKSWLSWTVLSLLLAPAANAQSPDYDPYSGSASINGGSPYADYRVDPAQWQAGAYGPAGGAPAADPYAGSAPYGDPYDGGAPYGGGAPYAGPPPAGHSIYDNYAPYSVFGAGQVPPNGVTLDPTFRAAAGLGGPSLAELDRIRFDLYRVNGEQAGIDQGYTNIGAFLPRRVFSDYNIFALNPRVLIDDAGNGGFNLGAIHRFYVPSLDRMFGHSYWWDYSRSYADEFNQVGFSLETVGRYFSLRGNANIVLGNSEKVYARQYFDPRFMGNNIVVPTLENFIAPVSNFSVEAAYPIPFFGKYGWEVGVGAYYLTASGLKDAVGVSGRFQWQITEDFWVNTLITNDSMFDTNVSVNFELRLPDGMPSRVARPNPVVMSLTQSVQRSYQVRAGRGVRSNYYQEINPCDNLPFQVAIIDPNRGTSGNGSAENPYMSLADYMATPLARRSQYDIIFVQPRSDGTAIRLNTGITLLDAQRLLGNGTRPDGLQHTYTSTRGTFFLPGQVAGPRPVLSNALVPGLEPPVITIAGNATEISNFVINAGNGGLGIASSGAIDGFNINNNTINNAVNGIRILSDTTPAAVNCYGDDLAILRNNVINGVGFGGLRGVDITHIGGTLGLSVADNRITGFAGEDRNANGVIDPTEDANGNGVLDPGEDVNGNGQLDLSEDVNNNGLLDEGIGFQMAVTGGQVIGSPVTNSNLPLGFYRNEFDQNGTGLRYNASNGTQSLLDVVENDSHDNLQEGYSFSADGGARIFFANFRDNTANNNGRDGLRWLTNNQGVIRTINPMVGNNLSGNRRHGMFISGDNAGQFFFQIGNPNDADPSTPDNVFNGNGTAGFGGDGIHVVMNNGAKLISGPGAYSGIFNAEILSNQGSGLTLDIMNGTPPGGVGTVFNNFQVVASNISNNGGDGILVSAEDLNLNNSPDGRGLRNLQIVNNTISFNTLNGINYQLLNSDLVNPVILGNTINSNGAGGAGPVGPSQFTIDVVFGGGLTPSQQAVFALAAARWSQIIIGDLPDVGAIDDLQIAASGVPIDGAGGILGQAGPTQLRPGTFLPYQGVMQFDTADLAALEASGQLVDVILHEMGHVIGLGTIWNNLGLLNGAGGANPTFTGVNATNEYNARFGAAGTDVPVENTGGPGTRDSHWRESIFNNELMTGFLNPGVNPISRITIGQWEDLGYVVNYNAADPYLTAGNGLGSNLNLNAQMIHNSNLVFPTTYTSAPSVVNPYASLVAVDPTAAGNGINFSLENSAVINGFIEKNTISGNGNDGVRMENPQFDGLRSDIDFLQNTITQNGGVGVNIALDNANELEAVFRLNNISQNTGGGINVDLTGNSFFTTDTLAGTPPAIVDGFTQNNIDGNGSYGLHVSAADDSRFVMNLSRPGTASTFIGNADAGVQLDLDDNATGVFNISNVNISNSVSGANGPGNGLAVNMTGNSALDLTIGSPDAANTTISGNAGDGVNIFLDGNANLTDALIQRTSITGNTGDGIHVERQGAAVIDNFRIGGRDALGNSLGNTITGNSDGIELIARQTNNIDDYTIAENLINNNLNRGIHVRAEGDAQMQADILFNQINGNTSHGIQLTTISNALIGDERTVTGRWLGNQINSNGADGINIGGVHGFLAGVSNPLQIGDLGVDAFGRSLGNVIRFNQESGIDIEPFTDLDFFYGPYGTSTSNIVNNVIANNVLNGIEVQPSRGVTPTSTTVLGGNSLNTNITDNLIVDNQQHGITLELDTYGVLNAQIQRNEIRRNGRDGIQILSSSPDQGLVTIADSNVFVGITDNNFITDNGGRGIDILVRGTANAQVVIDEAYIARNDEEGVYAVVTSSVEQDNEVRSNVPLAQTGSVFNDAFLDLTVRNSMIVSNNSSGGSAGGGLVLRVGTTGAVQLGNAAQPWADPGTTDPTTAGGLLARIDNNQIFNNFGVDFLMHTFTSTVNPTSTGGTWSDNNSNPRTDAPNPTGDNTFNPTNYQQDPLARITITSFVGNTGGSADVFGLSLAGGFTNQNFAFYNNTEDVFKSRTQNQDGNDPPAGIDPITGLPIDDNGPFSNGTAGNRIRNSTRLPYRRDENGNVVVPPLLTIIQGPRNSDDFLFPGLGDSTLRIDQFSDLLLGGFNTVISDFTTVVTYANSGAPQGILPTNSPWYVFDPF